MRQYAGAKFDAVITDPPYSSGGMTLSEKTKQTSEKYTNSKKNCPFPDFCGDQMDARSWVHMMADVFEAARDKSNESAICAAFCDWRQLPLLSDAMQWAGWTWRGIVVWDKMSSRPQKGRFRQQSEFVLWASNGRLPVDRPVGVLPGVYQCANVPTNRRFHQTQKPIELMSSLVKICVPGGLIFDPYMGSGSTLQAAMDQGYDAIGVELSPEIAQIAAHRLELPLEIIE